MTSPTLFDIALRKALAPAVDGRAALARGNHRAAQNDEREPGDLSPADLAEIDAQFAAPVVHVVSREHHGSGLDGYIVPVCICGWRGRAEEASNDYQSTNLREQERDHKASGQ